jgi:hypothetical protein
MCGIMFVGRLGQSSERSLLWLWTKAAIMLDWVSSTLDITTDGIFGISYCCMVLGIALCWCWQCLLKVCGNLLPHTVTPLDVTTVAWCCRQTQDVLHTAECQPGALQVSEWQWTASVFTTWHCTGSYSHQFTADNCLQLYLMWFACWADLNKCVIWHCASYWRN